MPPPINNAETGTNSIRGPHASSGEACWWTVSVNAQEVIRLITLADLPVNPLPYQTVQQGGSCSKLWAEVGWFREGIGRRAVMDISAGQRLSVNACNVRVSIITPPNCVTVRGEPGYKAHAGQPPATFPSLDEGPGMYLDTIFRASIVCSDAPSSFASTLLTQTQLVPNGSAFQFPCIPGALAADLYVPGGAAVLPGAPAFWAEFIDPTGTVIPGGVIGLMPFSGISADRTGILDRPGNAAGIAGTNTSGVTLAYTVVWHMEF